MQRKFSNVKKGNMPLSGQSADDLYEIAFSAPITHSFDDVWSALVKPEKLALWLMPVTGKMSKGGEVQLGDLAQAKVAVCEPKRRLSLILMRGGSQQALDITFSEAGKGKAKSRNLTVTVAARKSDLPSGIWDKYGPAVVGIGWELACKSLLAYLDTRKAPPKTGAISAFAASAAGRAYLGEAFGAWRAAAAGGADAAGMAEAPTSLLMFYTGLHT